MLKVFYGENRLEAEKAIKKQLGEGYEVYEGEELTVGDLPSVFQGATLFGGGERRKVLLKNVSENGAVWEKLPEYREAEHDVVVWEGKIDKRSAGYKRLKETGVEMIEFPALKKPEMNMVFGVLETAMRDGEKAVRMVEKIELDQDPYMFLGLLVSQALKRFENSRGAAKDRAVLKELAKLDLQMKTATMEPWMLVKGFLLRVGKV